MPDFNIHAVYVCASNISWETQIPSKDGKVEHTVRWGRNWNPNRETEYDYSCDCWGFKFHPEKWCSHIRKADPLRCKWNAEMEPTAAPLTVECDVRCPECKGPLDVMKVAV